MLSIEEVIAKLKDCNLKKVAKSAGINYTAVWRVSHYPKYGVNYETVKKLSDYLEGKE